MPSFNYSASRDGKVVKGFSDAASKEALIATLVHQGLKPLMIKEGKAKKTLRQRLKFGNKVKKHDLVIFTRQLSTMISAGVPLTRSLSTLQLQTENKHFKEVVGGITKSIEGGQSLASSLSKYPEVFNDVYVNMVGAGEAGGILDDILKRLAGQEERDAAIRKKIKSAMAYPIVISGIMVAGFFIVMIFIIPKISKILTDLGGPDTKLPIYTRMMLGVSTFLQHNFLLVIAANVIGVYLLKRYLKTPKGKYKFHQLLLRTPIVKPIIIKIAIARFSRTFASLMSSGVGVLDALEATGGAIGNKVIEAELKEAAKAVKNGKQLSEPLSHSKYFPAIVPQMLAIGEETGQIDTILVKVAEFYEEEVSATIEGLSSIIEPLMIVVLGAGVGLIAASVMGPIASLNQNIGTN